MDNLPDNVPQETNPGTNPGTNPETNQDTSQKSRAAKVIVPLLIVLAVITIWFVKDSQKSSYEAPIENGNPDFVLRVTDELDLEVLKSYGLPIVLDFGADACPPCRELAPTIAKLNKDLQGKAIIKYMDVWESPELAEGYPISVVPTLLFFDKDGKPYLPPDSNTLRLILYNTNDTEEHVFTAHEGGLSEEQILKILVEMGMNE